jgi:hypothetical protein
MAVGCSGGSGESSNAPSNDEPVGQTTEALNDGCYGINGVLRYCYLGDNNTITYTTYDGNSSSSPHGVWLTNTTGVDQIIYEVDINAVNTGFGYGEWCAYRNPPGGPIGMPSWGVGEVACQNNSGNSYYPLYWTGVNFAGLLMHPNDTWYIAGGMSTPKAHNLVVHTARGSAANEGLPFRQPQYDTVNRCPPRECNRAQAE